MRRARNENNERVFQVSEFLTSQQVASYFSRKKNSQTHKADSPLQAVCSTCVKYQLNLKTKEHLLERKIKDLRNIVRGLKLGVKGRKKDDVIQVLLRHASDCHLQETVSGYAKKHKHIITKVCESYTFIRQ